MTTIWKYTLRPGRNQIMMPRNPQLLTIDEQNGSVCLWARVDDEADMQTVNVDVVGTGHEVPTENQGHYIGTVKLENGMMMFHAFFIRKTGQ